MISPTACGARFSARTTPQPSQNLAEPRGTLVEPWWNPGGPLVEPWWNPRGTLVEPSWNPRGTLITSGPPRTTPEPIWAETPKLQLLGNNNKTPGVPAHVTLLWMFCHRQVSSRELSRRLGGWKGSVWPNSARPGLGSRDFVVACYQLENQESRH